MAEFIRSASNYSASQVDPDFFGLHAAAQNVVAQNEAADRKLREAIMHQEKLRLAARQQKTQQDRKRESIHRAAIQGDVDPTQPLIQRPTYDGAALAQMSEAKATNKQDFASALAGKKSWTVT